MAAKKGTQSNTKNAMVTFVVRGRRGCGGATSDQACIKIVVNAVTLPCDSSVSTTTQ